VRYQPDGRVIKPDAASSQTTPTCSVDRTTEPSWFLDQLCAKNVRPGWHDREKNPDRSCATL